MELMESKDLLEFPSPETVKDRVTDGGIFWVDGPTNKCIFRIFSG